MSKHNYSQYSNKKNDRKPEVAGANAPVNDGKPKIDETVNKPMVEEPAVKPNPVKMESIVAEPIMEPAIELIQETVETVTLPETVVGVAVNCARLNVRATPSLNAEILCVLDVGAEVQVDVANSDNEWFKLCTATGIEGYSMRNFINTHL